MTDTAKRLRKNRAARLGALMAFAAIIALAMAGQWAGPITMRVERVVDGDTLVVRYQDESHTVRLVGVDTPETVHPTRAVQYFGAEASAFTRARLEGKTMHFVRDRIGDSAIPSGGYCAMSISMAKTPMPPSSAKATAMRFADSMTRCGATLSRSIIRPAIRGGAYGAVRVRRVTPTRSSWRVPRPWGRDTRRFEPPQYEIWRPPARPLRPSPGTPVKLDCKRRPDRWR